MFRNSNKVYELIGVKVLEKEPKKVYAGKHAGKSYWVLIITCETKPEINRIQVFKDKLGTHGEISQEQMWQDIEQTNYADKRYVFYCNLRDRKYDLIGWKELANSSIG